MLEKLTIRNFQKHKKLEIEFDQYCTTIVGKSDVGKSAVLRALRWICINQPSGTGYIRHGEDACRVRLRVDKREISRDRGKSDNSYSLDSKAYHSLGQGGVPEEIQQLLNINPTLNFQNQMDAPFWFMLTPGEVSKQINQIINLELIDRTLSNIASQLRKVKSQVTVCEERLEETKQRVSELAWAKEADEQLQEIELLYKQIQDKTRRTELIKDLVDNITTLKRQRHDLAIKKSEGSELQQLAKCMLDKRLGLVELKNLTDSITQDRKLLDKLNEEIFYLNKELTEKMDGVCPLCKQTLSEV